MEAVVLEEWLRVVSTSVPPASSALAPASSQGGAAQLPANAIVQAWSQIRVFVRQQKALTPSDSEPFRLLNQHLSSLHLADSQARLLQALLSEVSSTDSAVLGFVRRFAVLGLLAWIRKSFTVPSTSTPSATSMKNTAPESLPSIVQSLLKAMEERPLSDLYTCEVILLLGAITTLPNVSASVRNDCSSAIARDLAGRRDVIARGALAEALAGAGYALAVSSQQQTVPIFQALLLLWTPNLQVPAGVELIHDRQRMEGEIGDAQMTEEHDNSILKDQIMLLHLMDFLGSILLAREDSQTVKGESQLELIHAATLRFFEDNTNLPFAQCTSVMACVGLLRSFYKWDHGNKKRGMPSPNSQKWLDPLRNLESIVVMICEQAVTPGVEMSSLFAAGGSIVPAGNRQLCRCLSLAVSRCRELPAHPYILRCLLFSIYGDALALDTLYSVFKSELATGNFVRTQQRRDLCALQEEKVLSTGNDGDLRHYLHDFHVHLDSFLLKEIGAVARAMCAQYRLTTGDLRLQTEKIVSDYTRNLYQRHRLLVAKSQTLKEQGWSNYRQNLEKVLEAAFMTVVIFFSIPVGQEVPKDNDIAEAERAALALDCLSCVEYFRHVQLREFSKVVQRSVSQIAGSEAASVLLASLIPPYEDIIKKPGTPDLDLTVTWADDEVQTARLLFYLRVMPLCLIKMPEEIFAAAIAPTMFLYLQHPSETVSKASHALFAAFLSLGIRSEPPVTIGTTKADTISSRPETQLSWREQLVVYYLQRTLQTFPGVTPFQGLVAGAGAIARQLPPGSPATVYCLKSLVEKTETLYSIAVCNQEQNDGMLFRTRNSGGSGDELRKDFEEVGAAQKLQILLLHLILLVDLQVLPVLLKLMAKLIWGLPKHFQILALAEAYDIVGCTNDYTRKPVIVPWLQSLSFLCSHSISKGKSPEDQDSSAPASRPVMVSDPESISSSNSVDVVTSNVGDAIEDEKETVNEGMNVAVVSQVKQPGESTPGAVMSDNDQTRHEDKSLEPMSKL